MSRFLVVEDEMILLLLIESMLEDLGHTVVASASNLKDGVVIAGREEFDCAVLDVNLNGQLSVPIAHVLTKSKIPFFFRKRLWRTGSGKRVFGYPCRNQAVSPKRICGGYKASGSHC